MYTLPPFLNMWQREWLYGDKVDFDGATRLIYINPEVTTLSVKRDIYSAWKRWTTLQENAKFAQALRVTGGEPVGGGQFTGDIYFLMNEWRIVIEHPVRITGILYHEDITIDVFDVRSSGSVISTVSSLAQSIETTVPVVTGDTAQIPAAVWAQLVDNQNLANSMGALIRDMSQNVIQSNVLTTSVSDQVESVDNKVTALDGKIDTVVTDITESTAAISSFDGRFDYMDDWASGINIQLTSTTDTLSEVSTMVSEVDARFDTVDANMAEMQETQTTLIATVADQTTVSETLQTDVTTVLANLGIVTELVNTVLKYSSNKTKIDQSAFTMTVYDDDGVTPIRVFDLKNLAGQPSVTQVAERRPR